MTNTMTMEIPAPWPVWEMFGSAPWAEVWTTLVSPVARAKVSKASKVAPKLPPLTVGLWADRMSPTSDDLAPTTLDADPEWTTLVEVIGHARHVRKEAHKDRNDELFDLIGAMNRWWDRYGSRQPITRSIVRLGVDPEDVRAELIDAVVRRQTGTQASGQPYKSKYDPTRYRKTVDDPMEAWCMFLAMGVPRLGRGGQLEHVLAKVKRDRLALDETEDHTRSRETSQVSAWGEALDDGDDTQEAIGLTLRGTRRAYSSDDTEQVERVRPPAIVVRRRGA